jgi:signal transduction histidine kinase
MKLIDKYNRISILATVAVLITGSICYYFIIRYALIHQLDIALRVEEAEIMDYVSNHQRLPQATNYKDQHISFAPAPEPVKRRFRNIKVYDPRDGDMDSFRELQFPVKVNGNVYTASVTKSEREAESMVFLILLITVGVIGLLLVILFTTGRLLFRNTWKSFYDTLHSIRQFNLSSKQYEGAAPAAIDEFRDLDTAVRMMTAKIVKDYNTFRTFADNASHEMQTPLAIIQSKLDLLIQGQNLDEIQHRQLQDVYDSLGRLNRLNQSLLLLSKIENHQFTEVKSVALKDLLEEKLLQVEDIIHAKEIKLATDLEPAAIPLNDYLAEILVNNLLNNAIRHNIPKGNIEIRLREKQLDIGNTGYNPGFDVSEIFERFKKGERSEGNGLGLAIVKQICDNYGFRIAYSYGDGLHHFRIGF